MNAGEAMTELVEVTSADFDWMLRVEPHRHRGLTLPPGGVDDAVVLGIVRTIVEGLHAKDCRGAWMMVSGGEVVGLCSYVRPPVDGHAEIGYGVAESRRGRGHAKRAVAAMLAAARAQGLRVVTAETAVTNVASPRALEHNGFERTGTRVHPEDGQVFTWRKVLAP
jgi:RimJ/RimL family protein N-acetyltransferase